MCGKYNRNNVGYEDVIVKANDSSLLKNLGKLCPKFSQFAYWSIEDSVNLDVWSHYWVEPGMKLMDINTDDVNITFYQHLEDLLDKHVQ